MEIIAKKEWEEDNPFLAFQDDNSHKAEVSQPKAGTYYQQKSQRESIDIYRYCRCFWCLCVIAIAVFVAYLTIMG